MTKINVLNNKFESKSNHDISFELTPEVVNETVVHQVVKSILYGRREGNASTKNKALVAGGGKKPFKQKGTGNARQGSSRSPLMPGGGTVFGPMTRHFEHKINKKMMLVALKSVLADKFLNGKLVVLDSIESNGKTNPLSKLLESRGLKSTLIVTLDEGHLVHRAASNLERSKSVPLSGLGVYDSLKYENLLIELPALIALEKRLVSNAK